MLGVMTPTHANSSGSPRRISSSGLVMTPTTSTGPGFGSMGSTGNSPMGGVTRTERKRRSTTYSAGPSAAAVGASRSRSGTLVNGGSAQLGNASSTGALGISSGSLLPPTLSSMQQSPSQLTTDPHLTYAHPQQTYTMSHPLGGSLHAISPMSTMQLQSSLSSAPLSSMSSVGPLSSSAAGGSLSVNPNLPNNSPLAMKELSPSIKPVIEDYLLRYLNHLCMNRTYHFIFLIFSVLFDPLFHPSSSPPFTKPLCARSTFLEFVQMSTPTIRPTYHGARTRASPAL